MVHSSSFLFATKLLCLILITAVTQAMKNKEKCECPKSSRLSVRSNIFGRHDTISFMQVGNYMKKLKQYADEAFDWGYKEYVLFQEFDQDEELYDKWHYVVGDVTGHFPGDLGHHFYYTHEFIVDEFLPYLDTIRKDLKANIKFGRRYVAEVKQWAEDAIYENHNHPLDVNSPCALSDEFPFKQIYKDVFCNMGPRLQLLDELFKDLRDNARKLLKS